MDTDGKPRYSLPNIPWPFPWPRKRDDDKNDDGPNDDSEFDPVLLIPGIGGSILEAVSDDGKRERIWVRLLNADHEFRTKLWSKFDPMTGKTVSLDLKSHIEVPDTNFGLYACDTLEPGLKINLDMVNYYHNMIEELHRLGFEDGTTLFGFGYDFRQSNRFVETMAALLLKLQSIHATTGKKVNVITHSMGGLLFKSFLALHHDAVESYVGKWISIAAPFRGAPGFIMDTLLTGVDFIKGWERNLFVAKWSMHQLLVECPSVYELMAEYEFDWDEVPELRIVRPAAEGSNDDVKVDKFDTPGDVLQLLQTVLRDNSVKVGGSEVKLPFSLDIVEWAVESRRLWHTAKLPRSVQFYNIFGHSNDTPHHTTYGTKESPIKEYAEILHTTAVFDNVDGDGTVPVESARADNLEALFRVGVPGEHRALLRDPRVFRLVEYFLEIGDVDPMYDPCSDFVVVPSKEEVEEAMAQSGGGGEGEVGLPEVEQVGVGLVKSSGDVTVEVGDGDVEEAAEVAVAAGGAGVADF